MAKAKKAKPYVRPETAKRLSKLSKAKSSPANYLRGAKGAGKGSGKDPGR